MTLVAAWTLHRRQICTQHKSMDVLSADYFLDGASTGLSTMHSHSKHCMSCRETFAAGRKRTTESALRPFRVFLSTIFTIPLQHSCVGLPHFLYPSCVSLLYLSPAVAILMGRPLETWKVYSIYPTELFLQLKPFWLLCDKCGRRSWVERNRLVLHQFEMHITIVTT